MRMRRYIAAGLALASGPALAQPNCLSVLCVYDAHNTRVGSVVQTDLVAHGYGGKPYSLSFDHNGFQVNALFVFEAADCSGHAYQWYDDAGAEPNYAQFDGESVWTSGVTGKVINAHSYSWYGNGQDQCINYPSPYDPYEWKPVVYEPVLLDTAAARWVPPFSVR